MIPTPVDLHGDNDCGLGVVETHISRLFFVEDVVYKSKKPVVNAFIDYSTSEKRRIACLREIELNARLAPDAYLGVLDLCVDGTEVDHVVMMKRYPDSVRLSSLLGTTLAASYLEQVAGKILDLHDASSPCPEIAESASLEAVTQLVTDGFAQLGEFAGSVLDTYDLRRAEFLARRYLQGRGKLFEDRVASGAARDGHGDLQADDIFCLEDGPRILDCLEFDDKLRYCD
jgi:aminoglycoside phosphotransferase family enzyme